jgi:SNF2 family DNA or RNA helicase
MASSKPMWQHQMDTIDKAFTTGNANLALFHEQGTGKTRTLIEILRRRFAGHGKVLNTLIICPLIVKRQWKAQIAEYSKIKPIDVVVLEGSEKRRIKTFYDSVNVEGQLSRGRIVIVNPATMEMKELMQMLHLWGVDILILDESHEFKAYNGVRAKALLPIADKALHKYIATGTPIANTESDIFMQYRILDGGKTFGLNFHVFRKKYYQDANASWVGKKGHFPKYECTKEGKEEISKLMYKSAVRALKKDCLDLPPFVRQIIEVEMSPEQLKAYHEMRLEFITWVKDQMNEPRAIVAQLALTKAMKMQQIISGFAFDENRVPVRFKKVPRLEVLKGLLENLCRDNKVIVWAAFIENYKMIADVCDELGIKYSRLVGGMTEAAKNENKDAFNTDPEIKVMIANQGAGGTGIDLIPASYAIYYSKDASILKDAQSEARNYRGGSDVHDKVTRIDLVCYGSLDETVNDALANKKDLAQYILDREIA